MKRVHLCCLVAAAALIAQSNASFFDDFNTPGTFQSNYNVYQNTTPPTVSFTGSPYTQTTTSGVSGSGGLDVATPVVGIIGDSTAINKNNVFDFSTSGTSL